ncbi:MAG: type II secretion system F family protein [Holosporales bacterium]|jgi:type II secretory pathway component PulF|nr:type II secretion system F family protein [Holosporales bacterium]
MKIMKWLKINNSKKCSMMKSFICRAIDKKGQIVEKCFFMNSDTDPFLILKNLDLTLISTRANRLNTKNPITEFTIPFLKNVKQLIKNKLDLITALTIVAQLFKNKEFRSLIYHIIDDIKSGSSFSKSLSKFERYFDMLTVKTLEISEKTAELPESLSRIISHIESESELRNKLKKAFRYPIILLFGVVLVFLFWLIVVVPQFAELFSEIGVTPPLISRIIIKLSCAFKTNLFYMVAISGMLAFIFFKKLFWQKGKISSNLPIISKINRDRLVLNFFSAMEIMLQEKITLIECIECLRIPHLKTDKIIGYINLGNSFSSALRKIGFLSDYELAIIETGERTGELCLAFKSITGIKREKLESRFKEIITMIQPITIGLIGILLIIIVYSLIIPLYSNLNLYF